MGVCLRSRDQTAKWGMAHEKFSSSEESTHEQIQGEKPWLLFFSTAVALCTKNLYFQDTVKHALYKDVLERFRKRVQRVRRDIADNWVLQHDNAPAHNAFNSRISGKEKHSPTSTSSLQPSEIEVEGSSFRDNGKHTKNCNWWAKHTYGKWLPVLLWSVEKMLEPLCNFPKVILWRR